VALGWKAHTGWAVVVALADPGSGLEIVAKRRIDMASSFDQAAVYHAARKLSFPSAEAFILSSEERFERVARAAISALAAELFAAGWDLVASAIASGTGKALPPLEAILESHALVHAAEGELFRRILANAGESCRIPSTFVPSRELPARAARAAGISEARLAVRLASLGKASGRPWAQDHKEATLAAWVALSSPRRERA
jgi:hypothetical protein